MHIVTCSYESGDNASENMMARCIGTVASFIAKCTIIRIGT